MSATRRAAVRPCTTPECLRMKELFSSWHEHSLHWRTRRSLETHLEACAPCRVFFLSMEETIVLVRQWPGVEVPGEVRGHLRELLRERHERAPARRGCGCAPRTGARPQAGAKVAPKAAAKPRARKA